MSVAALITRSDLNLNYGELTVQRFADDDGTGNGVDDVVDNAIQSASAVVFGWLRTSFTTDQVVLLAANDPSVVDACCSIAMAKLAERRAEFIGPDGKTLYSQKAADAVAYLKQIKKAEARPAGEAQAGANGIVPTFATRSKRDMIFQADEFNPRGKGGF